MSSLFERLSWWWTERRGAKRATPLWKTMRARGASRGLVRWAEPFGDDVPGAWASCPRPEWAVELATRAGVPRALIAQAVEDLAAVDGDDRPVGERARHVADGVASASAYAEKRVEAETFLDAVAVLASALIESRADVRAVLARSPVLERSEAIGRYRGDFDAVYGEAQTALADVVRERIPASEVRLALRGLDPHPYR